MSASTRSLAESPAAQQSFWGIHVVDLENGSVVYAIESGPVLHSGIEYEAVLYRSCADETRAESPFSDDHYRAGKAGCIRSCNRASLCGRRRS